MLIDNSEQLLAKMCEETKLLKKIKKRVFTAVSTRFSFSGSSITTMNFHDNFGDFEISSPIISTKVFKLVFWPPLDRTSFLFAITFDGHEVAKNSLLKIEVPQCKYVMSTLPYTQLSIYLDSVNAFVNKTI